MQRRETSVSQNRRPGHAANHVRRPRMTGTEEWPELWRRSHPEAPARGFRNLSVDSICMTAARTHLAGAGSEFEPTGSFVVDIPQVEDGGALWRIARDS